MEEKHKGMNARVLNKITSCLALLEFTGMHIHEAEKQERNTGDCEQKLRRSELGLKFYAPVTRH